MSRTMLDVLIAYYDRNLAYARRLVADVRADRHTAQPVAATGHHIPNHPIWVVGHLAFVADKVAGHMLLGLDRVWTQDDELFHGNSTPMNDAAAYPELSVLLEVLSSGHGRVADELLSRDDETLASATPDARFAQRHPRLGSALVHVMVGHENLHLGQLSAWRRALGLPPV